MSVIPEYGKRQEKPEGKEEGPKVSGVRKAAGILGLIAGIFLFLGYLGGTIMIGGVGAAYFKEILDMPNPPAGAILLGFAFFLMAAMAFILGILTLLAGIRSMKRSPAGTIRSGLILWSFLSLLLVILALISALSLKSELGIEEGIPLGSTAASLIGFILALIGAILVKPRASFGSWIAGSILILVGIIFVTISLFMDSSVADIAAMEGDDEFVRLINVLTFYDVPILIPMMIGAVGLIIAPFLGARNLWIVALLGIIAGIIAAVILVYYSATSIGDYWDLWKLVSDVLDRAGEEPRILLAVMVALGGLISSISFTIAGLIGIVALILGMVHVVMKRDQLFAAEAGQ